MLWILPDCIPLFLQKAVLWIPIMRSGSNFGNNLITFIITLLILLYTKGGYIIWWAVSAHFEAPCYSSSITSAFLSLWPRCNFLIGRPWLREWGGSGVVVFSCWLCISVRFTLVLISPASLQALPRVTGQFQLLRQASEGIF